MSLDEKKIMQDQKWCSDSFTWCRSVVEAVQLPDPWNACKSNSLYRVHTPSRTPAWTHARWLSLAPAVQGETFDWVTSETVLAPLEYFCSPLRLDLVRQDRPWPFWCPRHICSMLPPRQILRSFAELEMPPPPLRHVDGGRIWLAMWENLANFVTHTLLGMSYD